MRVKRAIAFGFVALARRAAGRRGELDAWRGSLGYSPPIAGLRAKSVAGALALAACGAAVVGGLAGARGDRRSPLPVKVRLATTERFDLLASNRLSVTLRTRRSGRVRVAPILRSGGLTTALGPTKSITLARGRTATLALPITTAGRAALEQCPVGRIGVRARGAAPRVTTRRLRLEAPACRRFFGRSAVWNTPLPDDATLDPESAEVTGDLLRKVDAGFRSDKPPTINTTEFTPPVYTVPADQPTVQVHLDRGPESEPDMARAFAQVPLPPDATPAPGTDSELVVWQPATDTLWEFWRLRREHGQWLATWGGRLDDVSTGPGHFAAPHPRWGTSASSLALVGGMITPRELARGEIDHALSLGIPFTRAQFFSLPAQRTDGRSPCPYAPPEGARFRLDPAVDVDALGLPAPVAAMARAAQRYGIYVRDQSGAVSFYAQSTVSLPTDPYPLLFGDQEPWDLLRLFPWRHLQLVKMELREDPGDPPPVLGGPGILYGC
jgi:hypothetical protein